MTHAPPRLLAHLLVALLVAAFTSRTHAQAPPALPSAVPSDAAAEECTDANLVAGLAPLETDIVRPHKLTDGRVPVEGSAYDGPESAVLIGAIPRVTFDLGSVKTVRALYLLADNNERFVVSISQDGQAFEPAYLVPESPEAGLRHRAGVDFEWRARFLRVEAEGGDGRTALGEVTFHCQPPATIPPPLDVVATVTEDPLGSQARFIGSLQGSLALVGLVFFVWLLPRLAGRRRQVALAAMIFLGAFGFVRFGTFHGGPVVHPWDSFHYFMGAKYFPELGYGGLYRCVADHERREGRGATIDAGHMRDLDTNVLHPGTFSTTPAGRCPATLRGERLAAFDADAEAFRPMFPAHLPFQRMLVDHGYNATPVHNAFLTPFTRWTPASRGSLVALAFLDYFAYLAVLFALYRGFGPAAAAVGALVIGTGEPWNYLWTGGSVGRAVWLALLVGGLALLAKKRPMAGAALVTASGLLRLFPLVFVGALGLRVLIRAYRDKRFDEEGRATLIGIFATSALLLVLGGVVSGFDSYAAFYREMRGHTSLVMANHVGLEALASYIPSVSTDAVTDARLTDPHEVMKALQAFARRERAPFWALGFLISMALVVVHAYRRDTHAWATVVLAGPLLFTTIAVSNYDCVWLVIFATVAAASTKRTVALLSFTAGSQLLAQMVAGVEPKHALISLGMLLLLAFLAHDVMRHGEQPSTG